MKERNYSQLQVWTRGSNDRMQRQEIFMMRIVNGFIVETLREREWKCVLSLSITALTGQLEILHCVSGIIKKKFLQ